jgi:peptidyl-prolyl cis-trans isomerase C
MLYESKGAAKRVFVRILPLILALVPVLVGCNACSKSAGSPDAGAVTSRGAGSLTPEQAAKVLAKVGDKTITLGDYVALLDRMDQFERLRYQSADRRKELLDEMINIELLADEAKAKGYDKDPRVQEEVRQILRDAMLARARDMAVKPSEIPVADVRAYYEAHRVEYKDPERRRVSMIVLRDAKSAEETQKALKSAKDPASATEWGNLVRARSIDAQAKADVPLDLAGDFGIVSPPGDPRGENPRVPEAVRVALFTLKATGEVAPAAVAANDKFYIVKLTGKTDPRERTFEEAERTIRVKLAQERAKDNEAKLLADLRKEFPVEINEAALAAVKVDLPDAGPSSGGK